jgi:hypothetical protein
MKAIRRSPSPISFHYDKECIERLAYSFIERMKKSPKFACLPVAAALNVDSTMNNPSSYTIEQQTNPHQHTKPQTNAQQTPQNRSNY